MRVTPGRRAGLRACGPAGWSSRSPELPFCGGPIDPAGHLCVRANGYRRREARRAAMRTVSEPMPSSARASCYSTGG